MHNSFNISQAVNRNINKMSLYELNLSIQLVNEVINVENFKYDKKLFKNRLKLLQERKNTYND